MHEEVAKWAGKVSLSLDNSELHKEHQLQHGFVLQLVLHFVSFAWFGLNFVHAVCDLRCSRALTWQKPLQRDLPSTHGFESLAPVEEQMHPFLGGKASFGKVSYLGTVQSLCPDLWGLLALGAANSLAPSREAVGKAH